MGRTTLDMSADFWGKTVLQISIARSRWRVPSRIIVYHSVASVSPLLLNTSSIRSSDRDLGPPAR